ncbi:MAG: hypothetical protein NUW02_03470 [Candidatus Campbellbacteria bacterium]|nr:hypothetical protein [Candidatus Campbellbacteria bacterium]
MRHSRSLLILFISILSVGFCSTVFAETLQDSVEARQKELEAQLKKVEKEIEFQQVFLDEKRTERVSLERDVSLLNGEIKKSQLGIQARTYSIKKIGGEIGDKLETIDELTARMSREKESLAQLIRETNRLDNVSLVEVALAKENISEFFEDLDSFDAITVALQGSFREIESTKDETHKEKVTLEERQADELELKKLQELEKKKIEIQEAQKKEVLTVTKGQETVYQTIIAQKQQTAAQIRAELFKLRGSSAISLGEAIDFAQDVQKVTGVRAALILGTLQEETRLGENLGTGNWITDSHPERDKYIFGTLMKDLGLNPDSMPVSAKPWYGWGGAMGPAQFIPSTWAQYAGYSCDKTTQTCAPYDKNKDRIGAVSGNFPPNPYNPLDAFTAAGILLGDNGATAGTRAAERLASLRYFAGWGNASKPSYAFYGDEVMALADGYQVQIDILKNGK